MEVANSLRRRAELSPERRKVWVEPKPRAAVERRAVPVVYYLSRGGHLEHPHFMEISLPSGEGLYLRDFISRLNSLRGKGMAYMYSWSSKRSYKNGFVWHDLTEDDFIYPAHANEYVLKGSEILHPNEPAESPESVRDDSEISLRRKSKHAWGSFDLNEYKVYKNKMLVGETCMQSTDACTQTEDRKHRNKSQPLVIKEEQEDELAVELSRDEISPPCSSSSSEILEGLIKADGSIVPIETHTKEDNVGSCSRRKIRTPAALMQLISCGSISVKDRGFSLVSQFKGRMPRVFSGEGVKSEGMNGSCKFSGIDLEDREYFSGSLVEMKRKGGDGGAEASGLRRSSSCNAERGLKMELAEKEIDGVRARCIPRNLKTRKGGKQAAVNGDINESINANDESIQN